MAEKKYRVKDGMTFQGASKTYVSGEIVTYPVDVDVSAFYDKIEPVTEPKPASVIVEKKSKKSSAKK